MNEEWFSAESSRNLVWFSLLSVLSGLSVYVERGRHRSLVLSIWAAVFALGVLCLAACAVGLTPNFARRLPVTSEFEVGRGFAIQDVEIAPPSSLVMPSVQSSNRYPRTDARSCRPIARCAWKCVALETVT